jgi:large repetitive protein
MRIPRCLSASIVALLLVPGALCGLAAPSGPEIRIAVAGTPAYPVTAVFPDGGFVVAWTTGTKTSVIHARLFAASGAPASGELRLVQPQPFIQQLTGVAVTADGGFAIVWEQSRPKNPDHMSVFARKFDRRANPLTAAFQVRDASPYSRYGAAVAGTADGGFVVAWGADSPSGPVLPIFHTDAVARFFHGDGTAAGAAIKLTGSTDPTDDSAVVPAAMAVAPDGSVAIVSDCFCDQPGLVLQRFARDGTVLDDIDPIPLDCTCHGELTLYPSLAMAPDGSFVVAWVNGRGLNTPNPADSQPSAVRARRFAADGIGLGEVFQVNQVGRLTTRPRVAALADGSFVIAWTDQNARDGSRSGVFARAYDANGGTSGPDLQLDLKATGDQFLTSISAAAGRAVAVWMGEGTRLAVRLLVPH